MDNNADNLYRRRRRRPRGVSIHGGDDYRNDVAGALQVGMHAIFFDPEGRNKYNYDWMIRDPAQLPEMIIRLMR